MDTQDNEQRPAFDEAMQEIKRLLAECYVLLARIDERRRQERGEDGFDG